MTVHDWHHTYTDAVEQFGGDTPSAQLEAALLEVFQERPEDITRAITKIGDAYRQGKVQSPWGALHSEVQRIKNRPHLVVAAGKNRTKQRQRAEQWIRNAGLYCPHWQACRDALIEDLHLEPALADQLEALYTELHPAGVQAEADAVARADEWKTTRAKVEAALRQPGALTEPVTDDTPIPA